MKLTPVAFAVAGMMLALAGGQSAFAQGRGGWVACAHEGGFCRTPYPTTVRYGARGGWAEQDADRGIPCRNDVFGDPAPGVVKSCFYRERGGWNEPRRGGGWDEPRRGGGGWDEPRRGGGGWDEPRRGGGGWDEPRRGGGGWEEPRRGGGGGGWQPCAGEGQFCRFQGPAQVRYGARGSWVTVDGFNGIACNNDVFGDPAPGVPKTCQVMRR